MAAVNFSQLKLNIEMLDNLDYYIFLFCTEATDYK